MDMKRWDAGHWSNGPYEFKRSEILIELWHFFTFYDWNFLFIKFHSLLPPSQIWILLSQVYPNMLKWFSGSFPSESINKPMKTDVTTSHVQNNVHPFVHVYFQHEFIYFRFINKNETSKYFSEFHENSTTKS